jgi:hypothetical protein
MEFEATQLHRGETFGIGSFFAMPSCIGIYSNLFCRPRPRAAHQSADYASSARETIVSLLTSKLLLEMFHADV